MTISDLKQGEHETVEYKQDIPKDGLKKGTATITVKTANGKKAKIKIKVK